MITRATQRYTLFETEAGFCGLAWHDAGITRFQLPADSEAQTERLIRRRAPDAERGEPTPEIARAIAAIRRYFAGEPVDFSELVLDLDDQSDFFRAVYGALRQIGWGRTTTYGELARAVGADRQAARDVGEAMARNPVALIIPCHRVLAAGGKTGGFSAPGGLSSKLRMLRLEGVELDPPPVPKPQAAQQSFEF